MFVVTAGGGFRGRRTFGVSDPSGAVPKHAPVRPDAPTATVFRALGFEPATEIRDEPGHPMPIATGESIHALFTS